MTEAGTEVVEEEQDVNTEASSSSNRLEDESDKPQTPLSAEPSSDDMPRIDDIPSIVAEEETEHEVKPDYEKEKHE